MAIDHSGNVYWAFEGKGHFTFKDDLTLNSDQNVSISSGQHLTITAGNGAEITVSKGDLITRVQRDSIEVVTGTKVIAATNVFLGVSPGVGGSVPSTKGLAGHHAVSWEGLFDVLRNLSVDLDANMVRAAAASVTPILQSAGALSGLPPVTPALSTPARSYGLRTKLSACKVGNVRFGIKR